MSTTATPTSPSIKIEMDSPESALGWPMLPTETEIYILPDGRVVIADLPVELAPVLAELGFTTTSVAISIEAESARDEQ